MKPIYKFHQASHISGDAQAVGERLDALREHNNGLTPDVVVSDARKPGSVLHPFFEWDDTKAAERYRLDQAGGLIRAVQVVFIEEPPAPEREVSVSSEPAAAAQPSRTVRAFVAIQRGDGARAYESTERAMADAEMRQQVIARAHGELDSVSRKYRELQELAGVFTALDQVGQQLRESTAV